METDPILGPVAVTVRFEDWRNIAGVQTPFRVEKRVDGALVRREVRETVRYEIIPNANDMLAVYLPAQGLLFNNDLFSPGREAQNPLWASELLSMIRFYGLDVSHLVGGHGNGVEPLAALEQAAAH